MGGGAKERSVLLRPENRAPANLPLRLRDRRPNSLVRGGGTLFMSTGKVLLKIFLSIYLYRFLTSWTHSPLCCSSPTKSTVILGLSSKQLNVGREATPGVFSCSRAEFRLGSLQVSCACVCVKERERACLWRAARDSPTPHQPAETDRFHVSPIK